jgi:hypothetical protein
LYQEKPTLWTEEIFLQPQEKKQPRLKNQTNSSGAP